MVISENPYMCYCYISDVLLSVFTLEALVRRLTEDAKHHAYNEAQQAQLRAVVEDIVGRMQRLNHHRNSIETDAVMTALECIIDDYKAELEAPDG